MHICRFNNPDKYMNHLQQQSCQTVTRTYLRKPDSHANATRQRRVQPHIPVLTLLRSTSSKTACLLSLRRTHFTPTPSQTSNIRPSIKHIFLHHLPPFLHHPPLPLHHPSPSLRHPPRQQLPHPIELPHPPPLSKHARKKFAPFSSQMKR